MKKRVLAIAFGLSLSAAAALAQDTCGIGTSLRRFNKLDSPVTEDFTVPLKVIENAEAGKSPFYFCDASLDLRPGIRFLNVYIDSVLSTGKNMQDPSIVYVKKLQAEMKAAINKEIE